LSPCFCLAVTLHFSISFSLTWSIILRNCTDPLPMAHALAGKDQWFVVHVLSGQENKVRDNIMKRVKTEEMGDLVYEVLVPTERVSEIKKGKKSETTRKFFPGYLIVNMHLLDENNQLVGRTWYFVRD